MRAFARVFSALMLAVAGCVFAITPAGAVLYTPGLVINSGNLQFTMDSCSVTAVGVVGTADCGQLNFIGLTVAGMFGFGINGVILSLGGGTDDVSLQYHVDVIPPPAHAISDAHLLMAGFASGPGAVIAVDETISDAFGVDGVLHADLTTPGDSTNLLRDATHLDIAKDILTFSTPGTFAEISIVDQYFSQIPEPTLMAVVGLGLTGLGLIRRRRKVA